MLIELRELLEVANTSTGEVPFEVGKSYLIRTVTHYAVGRLAKVVGGFLVLKNSSWVADTGRFHDAVSKGTLSEVEPFVDEHFVSLGAIVDATEWKHALPTEQK